MTIGQWLLRVAAVTVLLGAGILLTPTFTINPPCGDQAVLTCSGDQYVIPDVFWNPIIALSNLNEWFPFWTMMTIVTFDLAARAAMVSWFIASWVWKQVSP